MNIRQLILAIGFIMVIGFNDKRGRWTELDIPQEQGIKLAAGLFSYGISCYYWNGSKWIDAVRGPDTSNGKVNTVIDWMLYPTLQNPLSKDYVQQFKYKPYDTPNPPANPDK